MNYKKLNKLLVVDIECSCWPHQTDQPKNEVSEIIEVGLAVLDLHTLQIEKKEGILVKPTRSKISKFCTELTTLTQQQVDQGVSFQDACDRLQSGYDSKKFTWASWGQYDRKMFESQCRETYVDYPFSKDHINIKNVFAIMHGLPKELNVPKAMDHLDMPFKGTLHRGVDDAYNIALIFIDMLKRFKSGK